jgi:hypothetical protein
VNPLDLPVERRRCRRFVRTAKATGTPGRASWKAAPEATFFHRDRVARSDRGRLPAPDPLPAGGARMGHVGGRPAAGAGASWLFGDCAGVAAVRRLRRSGRLDEIAPRRCTCGGRPGARTRVQHLELRNRAVTEPDGRARTVRDVPQGAAARRRSEPARDPAQAAGDGAQGHRPRAGERSRRAASDRFFELYSDNQHRHGTPPFSAPLLRGAALDVRQRLRGADRARPAGTRCPRCCRSTSATRSFRTTPATTSARAGSQPTTSSTGN